MICVLCATLVFSAPQAAATTNGLAYEEDTIFTVNEGSVDVITSAVMTNTTSERRSGDTIFYSYFDTFVIVVPTDAQDLSISSRGQTLESTSAEIDDDFEVRTAALPTELRSGQSRTFTVTYSLPTGEIRGEGLFFSNPAFHAFPLWSSSDPGTGSLLLRVPVDAELDEFDGILRRTGLNDGYIEWTPGNFDVPEDVFTYVTIKMDGGLEIQNFTVLGQNIELRAWPGDVAWADFAHETITHALPALERQIGLPIPDQATLEVTESVTPYFYGYGGWYDQLETSIEIGNELDRHVMVHELSHAWFNNGLFDERWVSEGLAEEFTWQVQTELGWPTENEPPIPDTTDRASIPLAEWGSSFAAGVDDANFREREEYGYRSSWFVIRSMVEIIGIEDMREVLATADADVTAYLGANNAQPTRVRADWRRLLDLASVNASLEQQRELDQLFIDYVVTGLDVESVAQRRPVLNRYNEFAADAGDWEVPSDIRLAMELWQFDAADELMTAADEVHELYAVVSARAAADGLELSDAGQISYERNAPDFGLAIAVLSEQQVALDKVEEIRANATRELTTDEQWGLRDISLAPFVAQAETAFSNDDSRTIEQAKVSMDSLLVAASHVGAERILWSKIGGAAVVALLVLGAWSMQQRRSEAEHEFDVFHVT